MEAASLGTPATSTLSEDALRRIEQRVLWLAVRMIDHANRERPSADSVKIGGHQASSARMDPRFRSSNRGRLPAW